MVLYADDNFTVIAYKYADKPLLGIYYEEDGPSNSKVIVNNTCWTINNNCLSKGENYVGKINGSL
jgi:hypothetical protein